MRNTAAAYLEVLVVAWMEEKVCLSIIFLEEKSERKEVKSRTKLHFGKVILSNSCLSDVRGTVPHFGRYSSSKE